MPILRCTPEKAAARKKREKRVTCVAGPIGVVPTLPHCMRRWNHLAQGHCRAVRWLRQRTIDDRLPLETSTTRTLSCSRSSSRGLVRRACQTRGASWSTSLRTSEPQHKERLNRSATTSQVTSCSGHVTPPGPETHRRIGSPLSESPAPPPSPLAELCGGDSERR